MKSFRRLLSIVLTIAMLVASFATVSAANNSPSTEYWAAEALASAVKNGILQGKENGNLDPAGLLTRAEMAAIIVRAFGATVEADIRSYSDLVPSAWYYRDFAKAVHMGVFTGTGSGLMSPSNNITREEAFTVFSRAMVYESEDLSALSRYNDSASISQWAAKYVAPLASRGYVNGDDLGNFNPKANITRAEFAQFMHNMFKTYIAGSGTFSSVGADCVMLKGEDVTLQDVTIEGDLVIGDGAGKGKIVLKNVDVKGRILVRGAAVIKLVDTTVGDRIVVKNINNTVHFDNYKDYPAFKNISELTKVTYKTRSGGSSSSSSSETLKFIATIGIDPRDLELDSYYESDTRFADTVKDILSNKKTRILNALELSDAETKLKQNLIDFGVIDSSDNVLIQSIAMKFADIIGEENVEDTIISSANDLFTSNAALETEIVDYLIMHAESSNPQDVQTAKDLIVNAMRSEVETSEGMLAAKDMLDDFLSDPVDTTFYDIILDELASIDANVLLLDKPTVISMILDTFETDGGFREEVITSFAEYMISNTDIIHTIIDTIIDYIDGHPDVREQIVLDIIDKIYSDTFDLLLDQIINEEEFDVTPDNYFIAEGLKVKVEETTIDAIKTMIPARLFAIYPESKLAEIFNDAKDRLLVDINEAIYDAKHGQNAKIASGFTFIINPVEDIYIPVYERLVELLEGRFGDNYYYADNQALQDLIELFECGNVFTYDISSPSGYKIKSIAEYYDLMNNVVILQDEAMTWYKENLTPAQLEALMEDYEELAIKYANIFARIAGDYATNGTIPSVPGSEFIAKIEASIKAKYPQLVEKLIDKYNESDILKDIYTNEDYTKLQQRVKDAFDNVDMTTDEFFDKLLKKAAVTGKVTKISEDEYEIAYDKYSVNFRRVAE